jgi:hypothetical protein
MFTSFMNKTQRRLLLKKKGVLSFVKLNYIWSFHKRHEIYLYLNFKFYMHNFPGLLFNNVTVLIILAMPKCYCLCENN